MLVLRRGLASAAPSVAQQSSRPSSSPNIEEKISRLSTNGLTVASVDLHGAVSQLVLAYRAGSKYEKANERGLVHHLRNCIGTDSGNYLGSKLLWQSGLIGSNLVASATKDSFIVQMNVVRTLSNVGLSILGEIAQPAFKVWDLVDVADMTMNVDLETQSPLDIAIENLHSLAYRENPLGNPLLAPSHRIGKVKAEQLVEFASERLVASEAVLVGVNVDHESLLQYALNQGSIPEQGSRAASKVSESPYHGGMDARVAAATPLAHVVIAGKGAKLTDAKSVAVQTMLSTLLAGNHNVKFTDGPPFGAISKRVFQTSGGAASVQSVDIVHSDAGMVGVYIAAGGDVINSCVKSAVAGVKELSDKGVNGELLAVAKKMTEVNAHKGAQNAGELALDKAIQLTSTGQSTSLTEFIHSINDVTVEDVKKAAGQMLNSKLNISSYGNISQVPYADELGA